MPMYFDNDDEALSKLGEYHVPVEIGLIYLKIGKIYPQEVHDACDYLISEWDYAKVWKDRENK